jgi:Flp pilus assembly protein TadD
LAVVIVAVATGGTVRAAGESAAGGVVAGAFDEGERLFRADKPKEAIAYLERAILEPGIDERAWLYLGIAYQQLGRLDDAARSFRAGSAVASRFKHLF